MFSYDTTLTQMLKLLKLVGLTDQEGKVCIYPYNRTNSHILKGNKNQMKQGIQKILILIKSTYNAVF